MKRRVLTSLIAIPIVLLAVASSTPAIFVLILLACFLCLSEAVDLLGSGEASLADALPVLALVVLAGILNSPIDATSHVPGRDFGTPVLLIGAWGLWIAGLICTWRRACGSLSAADRIFSHAWFAVPLLALLFLHPFDWSLSWAWSWSPILLVVIPVWAGDIAAMLAGRAWGKHLLAPSISPKKTWEGAIANLIASMLFGVLIGLWLGYPALVGLACGTAIGVFGQLGDLFESALKRAAGKKDSGDLLPGHGGLLDRIDSLLGCILPVWLILWVSGVL